MKVSCSSQEYLYTSSQNHGCLYATQRAEVGTEPMAGQRCWGVVVHLDIRPVVG